MPRVRLIEEPEALSQEQSEVFEEIVASRGRMLRPFAVLLHRPQIARGVADLGAVIRYQGTLSDGVRELAICTTAIERDCEFEWSAHLPLAREAGVSQETLDAVQSRTGSADDSDAAVVEFARALCRTGAVDASIFGDVRSRFGDDGAVELASTVGYYMMLAVVMSAADAC